MPYIPSGKRALAEADPQGPGELTFAVTRMCDRYCGPDLTYARIAEVLGSLAATQLEFYRRVAAPHEDRKMIQNGDVYMDRT